MSRTDIDADATDLEKILFPRGNKRNYRAQFIIAQRNGKKISEKYEAYLASKMKDTLALELPDKHDFASFRERRSSRTLLRAETALKKPLSPKQQRELADGHYNYAMHLVTLRTYYFLCFEQEPETSLEPDYLNLALQQSTLALQHFNHAYELYIDNDDKISTQDIWDEQKKYHCDVVQALGERALVTITSSSRKRSASSNDLEFKRPKLTVETSPLGLSPHSFWGTPTSLNTSQATSARTPTLSSLEELAWHLKTTGHFSPGPSPEDPMMSPSLFKKRELLPASDVVTQYSLER